MQMYTAKPRFIALLFVLYFIFLTNLVKAEDEIFMVKNIHVFYDAGNLKDSKKIALSNGVKEGLKDLLFSITASASHSRLNYINLQNFTNAVKEIQFLDERMTSHSYMATINVAFHQDKVKSLLNNFGVMYKTKMLDSFIIIPFLKNSMNWLWFNGEWKRAWDKIPDQVGMVRPIVIRGNLQDIDILNLNNIMKSSYIDFIDIMERYKVDSLILIEASQYETSMELSVRFLGEKTDVIEHISYEQIAEESQYDWYKRISNDILLRIDSRWKGNKKSFS